MEENEPQKCETTLSAPTYAYWKCHKEVEGRQKYSKK